MTNNDQTDDIYALASAEQTISPRADSDRKRRLAGTEFDREAVNRIYERWAPIYDFVFGPLFDRGRQAAIDATAPIGGRILDVGVGTGIALPHYGDAASVVGVDLSLGMLRVSG
jgi:ubiquinone/menaquinone biosynthesis C-methylase UbiE